MRPAFPAASRLRAREALRLCVALGVLAMAIYLVAQFFLRVPDFGWRFLPRTWSVTQPSPHCPTIDCPQYGDRILRIGHVTFDDFNSDRNLLLPDTRALESIEIEIEREGSRRTLQVPLGPTPPILRLATTLGAVGLALIFWLAGTAALLFLRPLAGRGWLYVSLFYGLTILFAASWSAWSHIGFSWYLLRLSIWAVVPMMVHFHCLRPEQRFGRLRYGVVSLYLASALGLVADFSSIDTGATSSWMLFSAISFSILLLFDGSIRPQQPALRSSSRIMATGLLLGVTPFLGLSVIPALAPSPTPKFSTSAELVLVFVAIFSLPIWPATYLYVAHRRQSKHLRFRANMWLGRYGFYSLLVTSLLCLQISALRTIGSTDLANRAFDPAMSISLFGPLLLVLLAPAIRPVFQNWVDRTVFGLEYDAEKVLRTFARRIPTVADREGLRRLVCDEILPTLMIRRSALFLFQGGDPTIFYLSDDDIPLLTDEMLPEDFNSGSLLEQTLARTLTKRLSWCRLALPLRTDERMIGVWLFGDRDPDDVYSSDDVTLLTSLANMIASVLQAQQAAEAKARFLANISHELRTPMNGVLGMAGILSRSELTDEQRQFCDSISSSGQALQRLLDDVLELSKLDAGRLTLRNRPIDLYEILEQVVQRSTALASEKGLNLTFELSPSLPRRFWGDAERIGQILQNLVDNAIKFTDRGSITVRALRPDEAEPTIIRFAVTDTGIGISESALASIFDRFSQVDASITRKYSGVGLGLAICVELAELLGGSLEVKSAPGKGSTFWIDIPLQSIGSEDSGHGSTSELRESDVADLASFEHSCRALVAEDDEVNSMVIEGMLEVLGIEATLVEDGQKALESIAQDSFDFILMDCQMPLLDGVEATRRIRQSEAGSASERIPIIGVTAHALPREIDLCYQAGMDDIVTKPVDLHLLQEAIARQCRPSPGARTRRPRSSAGRR